jgi:hypothetical protein
MTDRQKYSRLFPFQQEYRGVTIEVFPYEDAPGWNAVVDFGNGPEDCYAEANSLREALRVAREMIDREWGTP